jgi:hypothetical protein
VIEIRQVQEMSEFPADVQKAAAGFPEMQTKAGPAQSSEDRPLTLETVRPRLRPDRSTLQLGGVAEASAVMIGATPAR